MNSKHDLVEQAQRRLSAEYGAIRRHASHRVALCYPSPYHVGMSSLGFQTIYRELNGRPATSGERTFLPDDVASSVAYELELTGVLEMLDLSGIPVLAEERRTGEWPLVVAGGPLTFSNPD